VKFESLTILVVRISRMRFKLIEFYIFCLIFFIEILKASSEECGKQVNFNALSFGGQKTRKNEWPWLVALVHREYGLSCGGSLLSKKHILSGIRYHSRRYLILISNLNFSKLRIVFNSKEKFINYHHILTLCCLENMI
jgi:Trypsin